MFIVVKIIEILASLLAGFLTLMGSALLVTLGVFGQIHRAFFFVYYWAHIILFLSRVRIEVKGREVISNSPCLYVFNHSSLLDIPILFLALNKMVMFGAKKELFFIPIFGWSMKVVGVLEIDRGDRNKAIETLKKSALRIKNGESFILAAEGTRTKESGIGEFKTGPFALAIDVQCPIQPVVIAGAFEAMPKSKWFFNLKKENLVKVEILPAVSTEGLTFENRQDLKDSIRKSMVNSFEKL